MDGTLFEQESLERPEAHNERTTLSEQYTQFPYAYHFDAPLLAGFLTEYATTRGARYVLDDVVDVVQDERGWISHLVTREHGEISGDLFIDRTGFRGMLLNKTLGEPFVSFQETLPNDSAVALRVPSTWRSRACGPARPPLPRTPGGSGPSRCSAASPPDTCMPATTPRPRRPSGRCGSSSARKHRTAARSDNAYWRDAKTRPMPDGLAERIERWRAKAPTEETIFPHYHGFESYSYLSMLLGLGGVPLTAAPALALMDQTATAKEFRLVKDQGRELVNRLPSHYEYLAQMH